MQEFYRRIDLFCSHFKEKRHHKPNCYRKILPPQRNESYIFHGFPLLGTLNENYNKKYYVVEEDRSNMQTLNRMALNDDKMFLIYTPYL